MSQYFYPESFRGNDIVFDFIKRGHDVTVLTAKPNYPQGKFYDGYGFFKKRYEVVNGAKIIRVPVFPRGNGRTFSLALNYISFVFFSFFACRFRIREKYDLIFVQQLSPVLMAFPGLWVKKKQKIPLFLWVLDLWPESLIAGSNVKKGIVYKALEFIVKRIYNASDVILISSQSFRESILRRCTEKEKKIIYFPNWAEDSFAGDGGEEIETPLLPQGFNIMFAGNIGESQDFQSILRAAEMTIDQNVNWILIGEGRKSQWVREEVANRKLSNVYLMGRHPIEQMPFFFKKADALLVSLKDEPIFSLTVPAKVQAYMASRQIVLGMLNGEGKDLINTCKCGIAVSAGDYSSLVDAIFRLIKLSAKERTVMRDNGFLFYEKHFSKRKLFDSLESMFSSLGDELVVTGKMNVL